MVDILNSEKGPFQAVFGDDASADPMIVIPIVFAVFALLLFIAFRVLLKDKGKSEMTEEELEKDRALFDDPMRKHAEMMGEVYDVEKARAIEARDIAEAKRRYDKNPDMKE